MSRWPKCAAHPAGVALKESSTIDASAPAWSGLLEGIDQGVMVHR